MMRKLLLTLLLGSTQLFAQKQTAFLDYISQYSALAVEQMKLHDIPASITLAQGLHESNAGRSLLALEANNHFGIKVGSTWTGPYIIKSDDRPDDRFRVYNSVHESYEDHSLFLKQKRYQPLFELSSTDYQGWAKGLKECGYATNPAYAEQLIKIIEDYKLYAYDDLTDMGVHHSSSNYYVIVKSGETLESIAARTHVSPSRLIKYNELPNDYVLAEDDIIYLKKKRRRATKDMEGLIHTVREGESMHSISQLYGIRLSGLYKVNHLPCDYWPRPGDLLKVR